MSDTHRRLAAIAFTYGVAVLAVFALAGFAGCDSGGKPARLSPPEPARSYRFVADVRQTMEWIVDPAADVIWGSAGAIVTADGETDLAPTTDSEWEQVRNSAVIMAEAGNLLMMPGRALGPDWVAHAQALTLAGQAAMAAAQARDADALFAAGGQLYEVCRACHEQYLVPLEEARRAQ